MDFFIPSQSRCARQLIPFWRKCATSPGRGSLSKGRALGKPVLAIGFRPAGSFAAGLRGFVSVFERMCNCGMKSEHLVGTNIPRFTYDTPTVPENDFYALCEGSRPLCMIFLPGFDHPVSREYITRYLKTLPALKGARLACVVRSSAKAVATATRGSEFPFPVICDGPGVLYGYLGVEQTRGLLSWSFAAQKIYKAAKDAGYHYDKSAPQILPLTLVVGPMGRILFTHSGRSQTDLPEDCAAIHEVVRAVVAATVQARTDANPHCSDETLTLPDLMGWDDGT